MRSPRVALLVLVLAFGCGDDDEPSSEADRLGVGAECASADDCRESQVCLAFKAGYCGVEDCERDADCPEDAACVEHDDGVRYCFRTCREKDDCNRNRNSENEANCSSSVTFVEDAGTRKACVPPSGT